MRCVIYGRVSSDKQREMGTIESQREALLDYARSMRWTLVSLEEDDGLTGDMEPWERPAMARVLSLVRQRAVDVLLVIDVDRISRDDNNIAFAMVRKELRDHGIKLFTPRGEMDLESPEQRLQQDVLAALASFERHKIKERCIRGRKSNIRKGGRPNGFLPTGYGWDKEGRQIVVAEQEAVVVREIFRLIVEDGLGMDAVTRALKRQGLKTGRT